jgi:Flp pilus assembly protein TadD
MESPSVPVARPLRRRAVLAGLALAAVLGGAIVTALAWGPIRVSRAAEAAREAVAARRYRQAEGPLATWLAARPDAAEAHYLKARVALGLERGQEAFDELSRAYDLGYPEPELEGLRGLILARSGQHSEAEPLLIRARDTAGGPEPEVSEGLARVYLESFRLGAAAEALKRWRRAAPDDPRPYLWQAEVDSRTSSNATALLEDYRNALRLDPDLDAARLGVANVLRRIGRHEEAAAEFSTYLKRRPDDPEGYNGAGLNALEAGDDAGARAHFEKALTLDAKSIPALVGLADLALRRRESVAALALLDRVVRIAPYEADIQYRRSQALQQLGRVDEARTASRAFEQLRRDSERLQQLYRRLIERPRDAHLRSEIARWMIEHGREDEGLDWARLVLAEQPGHRETNRMLAEFYRRKGELGRANYYQLQAGNP